MCVTFFSYKQHEKYPLLLTLNRDEFYNRPTTPLHIWTGENVQIASGIDEKKNGTWLGINETGQMAAITNFRNPATYRPGAKSRGMLVRKFLETGITIENFISELRATGSDYNGYSLIFGDVNRLNYFSNVDGKHALLAPGLYGLSNHFLDTAWFKVTRGKSLFSKLLKEETPPIDKILQMMEDRVGPPDAELQVTGLNPELERMLSTIYIASAHHGYGTRSTSIVSISNDGLIKITEKTHPVGSQESGIRESTFSIQKISRRQK